MKSTSLNLFFRIFLPPIGLLLFISILSSCNIGNQKKDKPTIKKHDDSKLIRGNDSVPVPITFNELDTACIYSNDNSRIIIEGYLKYISPMQMTTKTYNNNKLVGESTNGPYFQLEERINQLGFASNAVKCTWFNPNRNSFISASEIDEKLIALLHKENLPFNAYPGSKSNDSLSKIKVAIIGCPRSQNIMVVDIKRVHDTDELLVYKHAEELTNVNIDLKIKEAKNNFGMKKDHLFYLDGHFSLSTFNYPDTVSDYVRVMYCFNSFQPILVCIRKSKSYYNQKTENAIRYDWHKKSGEVYFYDYLKNEYSPGQDFRLYGIFNMYGDFYVENIYHFPVWD